MTDQTIERPRFFTRLLRALRNDAPEARPDHSVEIQEVYGFTQATYLQISLSNIGLYSGEIDGEIVSPGLFHERIEPDMRRALEAYIALRREEGVELGEELLSDAVIADIIDHTPIDIRTARNPQLDKVAAETRSLV